MTFQSIEAPILEGYLHLKNQAFSDFVKAQGWTESNGVVSIPINKDNEAKTTVLTENIKFERKEEVASFYLFRYVYFTWSFVFVLILCYSLLSRNMVMNRIDKNHRTLERLRRKGRLRYY